MSKRDHLNSNTSGSIDALPDVPFQIRYNSKDYTKRYDLDLYRTHTVTNVRYCHRTKGIRYNTTDELFDLPWEKDAIKIMELYFSN